MCYSNGPLHETWFIKDIAIWSKTCFLFLYQPTNPFFITPHCNVYSIMVSVLQLVRLSVLIRYSFLFYYLSQPPDIWQRLCKDISQFRLVRYKFHVWRSILFIHFFINVFPATTYHSYFLREAVCHVISLNFILKTSSCYRSFRGGERKYSSVRFVHFFVVFLFLFGFL